MMNRPSLPNAGRPQGIVVAGTHPRCGKTVACAGLAGVLSQLGFRTQAAKPLVFTPKISLSHSRDLLFFNRVLPPWSTFEPVWAESAHHVSVQDWQRILESCRKQPYGYILETPGLLASPLRYLPEGFMDASDLAQALQNPLLLVTPKQPDIIAALAPAFAYCRLKNTPLLGWIAVETSPTEAPHWDTDVLSLTQQYQVPYLGKIAYSPSISVEACQQGNLLRMTEMGVDLLPIQQELQLLVP
ncbi:MAG TPA: dethiobiotin synthase [Oculatellaceae cyanobacterium]|jgi:dethiobiotin synthetase